MIVLTVEQEKEQRQSFSLVDQTRESIRNPGQWSTYCKSRTNTCSRHWSVRYIHYCLLTFPTWSRMTIHVQSQTKDRHGREVVRCSTRMFGTAHPSFLIVCHCISQRRMSVSCCHCSDPKRCTRCSRRRDGRCQNEISLASCGGNQSIVFSQVHANGNDNNHHKQWLTVRIPKLQLECGDRQWCLKPQHPLLYWSCENEPSAWESGYQTWSYQEIDSIGSVTGQHRPQENYLTGIP